MRLLKIALAIFFALAIVQPTLGYTIQSVEWYQIIDGKEVPVKFFVYNVPYEVKLKIYSEKPQTIPIKVKLDRIYAFDVDLASQMFTLNEGINEITIKFVAYGNVVSKDGSVPDDIKSTRGVFVEVGSYSESPQVRFSSGTEIPVAGYYWVGLRPVINGNVYDDVDAGAPCPSLAKLKMYG